MYREYLNSIITSIWPSILILVTILFSIRFFGFLSNKKRVVFYHEILQLIFIVYLMCFFYVLTFADVDWSTANFIPFKEMFRFSFGSRMFFRNILGNIILFLPYGFFLSYFVKLKRIRPIIVMSFCVSFIVEIIQFRIGRVFDVDDITLNVVGGIIGYLIYRLGDYLLNNTKLKSKKELICNIAITLIMIATAIYLGV